MKYHMKYLLLGLDDFKRSIKTRIRGTPLIEAVVGEGSSLLIKLSYRIPHEYLWEEGFSKDFWAFIYYTITIFINGDFIISDPKCAPVSGGYKGISKTFIGDCVSKLITVAEIRNREFKTDLLEKTGLRCTKFNSDKKK